MCARARAVAKPLRPDGVALVEALDAAPQPKVACDLPSGLDCDTGAPLPDSPDKAAPQKSQKPQPARTRLQAPEPR